eukprot:COSAG01_NODE_520_length_16006_cov_6.454077_5_plen_106_part_00
MNTCVQSLTCQQWNRVERLIRPPGLDPGKPTDKKAGSRRTGPTRSADHAIGPLLSKEAGMGKRVMADGQMGTRLTPTPTASPHYQDPDGGEHKWRCAYKTKYGDR